MRELHVKSLQFSHVSVFSDSRESVQFSHVRVFSDSSNVQKRATKSDTSVHLPAEQVYFKFKLQVTNFENKEVIANTKLPTLKKIGLSKT